DTKYEGSAGYSFLREEFSTNRHGWVLSFTEKVGNRVGIEAEVGGNYRKATFLGSQNDFVHSILAGPQFKLRNDAKLVPWGHVLVVITLDNVARPLFVATRGIVPIRATNVRFGFHAGGGIAYWRSRRVGIARAA